MKKLKSLLIITLCFLFFLSGCNKGKEEEETDTATYNIAGNTYYNTVDNYGHEDHSKVWFGKDSSFVLNDSYTDGYNELTGNWSISENVITLNVDKATTGSFSKLLFEIKDDDTLVLKTTLSGSKSDDIFSINEIKGSTVKPDEKKEDDKKEETDNLPKFEYTSFYNISQSSSNKSRVELRTDGSFAFIDCNDYGISEYNGTYVQDGDILKLSAPDKEIEMLIQNKKVLVLQNDVGVSATGDKFTSEYVDPNADKDKKEDNSSSSSSDSAIPCTSISSLYNNYWAYEGVSAYDLEVKVEPSNTTDKITYSVEDENVVKVNSEGIASTVKAGETKIHIKCGKQERIVNFEVRSKDGSSSSTSKASTGKYKATIADVNDMFQPTVEFDDKGNFVYTENVYAGMVEIKGTYKEDDTNYVLTVTDNSGMQGFAGQDVKEIVLKKMDKLTLKLKTQICMSDSGVIFKKQ